MDDPRSFPARPILGVGAVILDGDQVLLVKRAHEPLKGQWSLPGGAVEIGETLEDALRREVLEETGLAVSVGPVIEVFERIQRAADGRVEYHFVIVDYLCRPMGSRVPIPASDAEEARWVDRNDFGTCALTAKATEVITKAFEMRG